MYKRSSSVEGLFVHLLKGEACFLLKKLVSNDGLPDLVKVNEFKSIHLVFLFIAWYLENVIGYLNEPKLTETHKLSSEQLDDIRSGGRLSVINDKRID